LDDRGARPDRVRSSSLENRFVADPVASARSGPTEEPNNLVDVDHDALFPQNKQNEPSITRDPLTGALIDGSSYKNLMEQFLGDYIQVMSGPASAYTVWTDSRNATPCAAVDAYRTAVYGGSKTPWPQTRTPHARRALEIPTRSSRRCSGPLPLAPKRSERRRAPRRAYTCS